MRASGAAITAAAIAISALLAACEDDRNRGGGPITRPRDAAAPDANDPPTSDDGGPSPIADAAAELDARPSTADAGDAGDAGEDAATPPADAATPPADAGSLPLCLDLCTVPSDCVSSPTPLTDSDNYTCPQGRCEYLGCNNDTECQTTFNSTDYVCVLFTNAYLPACVHACSAAADCASPTSSPLFGADNYQCTQGGCEWLGCTDAQECRDTFQDPTYVCELQPGAANPAFKNCLRPCNSPSDCGSPSSPAYDADNYRCTAERCEYLGCNDTAECQASFPSGNYVCE